MCCFFGSSPPIMSLVQPHGARHTHNFHFALRCGSFNELIRRQRTTRSAAKQGGIAPAQWHICRSTLNPQRRCVINATVECARTTYHYLQCALCYQARYCWLLKKIIVFFFKSQHSSGNCNFGLIKTLLNIIPCLGELCSERLFYFLLICIFYIMEDFVFLSVLKVNSVLLIRFSRICDTI